MSKNNFTTPPPPTSKSPRSFTSNTTTVQNPIITRSGDELSNAENQELNLLADKILDQLAEQGFKHVFLDFDGTITREHTNQNETKYDEDLDTWFANKHLLKKILEKSQEKPEPINFYIASFQSEQTIRRILGDNLCTYFKNIYGREFVKEDKAIISEIANLHSEENILYIDDDPQAVKNPNVTILKGILDNQNQSKKRNFLNLDEDEKINNLEYGLTKKAWKIVADCLEKNCYDLTENYKSNNHDFIKRYKADDASWLSGIANSGSNNESSKINTSTNTNIFNFESLNDIIISPERTIRTDTSSSVSNPSVEQLIKNNKNLQTPPR